MTLKNPYITVGFAVITIAQLGLGICLVTFAARSGGTADLSYRKGRSHSDRAAQPIPPIPVDAYRLCVFVRHRALEVAYTSISLFYGDYNYLNRTRCR